MNLRTYIRSGSETTRTTPASNRITSRTIHIGSSPRELLIGMVLEVILVVLGVGLLVLEPFLMVLRVLRPQRLRVQLLLHF